MIIHLFCGLTIASNIPIPELPIVNSDKVGFQFKFRLENRQKESKISLWSQHWWSSTGEQVLSYSRQSASHWLRFPGLADFRISENTQEISCYPLAEIPEETIRHLFLDQVLPRCLAYQGKVMIHASAVWLEQGLLIFTGESGAGKSTLAGNFHQAGQPALADDCIWIKESRDKLKAIPSYGGLRLWTDSFEVLFAAETNIQSMAHYSDKTRVLLNENGLGRLSGGAQILAMIILAPVEQSSNQTISLQPLSLREAYIEIAKQTFQLDMGDLNRFSRHMKALGRIVPRLSSFRLCLPRDYSLLPTVRQMIIDKVV